MAHKYQYIKGISRASARPLHRQIKEALIAECRHKHGLKEGASIDSVRVLCRRYAASRMTIQKTIDELKSDGLAYSVPKSGVFWGRQKPLLTHRTVGVAFSVFGGPVSQAYSPYFYTMLEGMHKVFLSKRYSTKIMCYEDLRRPAALLNAHCDGIIFTCSHPEYLPVAEHCRKIRMPYLLLDRPVPDESLNYLERDGSENIRDLTTYLLDLGHQKIGCIGHKPILWIDKKLYLGYRAALESRRSYNSSLTLAVSRRSHGNEYPDAAKLLALCRNCTALIILETNPKWVEWVVTTLLRNNIRVPDDCSVVSLSIKEDMHVKSLAITHFPITPYQMGVAAAKGFLKMLEGEVRPPLHITFPTRIRHGKSVKALR